jgi:hypothetical protein
LIFDDVIHRKQVYPNTLICLFLTRGVGTNKTFTLKLIIQRLLWYNRNIFFDLTKTKALLMASTSKVALKAIICLSVSKMKKVLQSFDILKYQTF